MSWAGLALWLYHIEASTLLLSSSAVAAGLILVWLRQRWGSYQDMFIAKLGISHKRLSKSVEVFQFSNYSRNSSLNLKVKFKIRQKGYST